MADTRKEQERDELQRAIWAVADELRGSVDGWDFKSYVLGTMFYRYISENLTEYINAGEIAAGNEGFDYAKLSDSDAEEAREGLVQEKGFFMLPSELFCNVRARAPQDDSLNETLEKVFRHIEESAKGSTSEKCFSGLFDDFDVNSNKLGATVAKRNKKLVKLLNGIGGMNLGEVRGHSIDAFGDAYEFLMTMYASNAGKSGGEFFTPSDVSELLTRLGTVGKTKVNKVYDPACGSGSLLLKARKVLGKAGVQFGYFGQEVNITTYNLCRINMFLHDVGFDKFDIACEDTLTAPQHWDDEPFELIVSNPPYSIKWAGDSDATLINDPRFAPAGVLAPKSKADLAFIMHSLSWLAPNGTAAIVCFPGIMYRGGAEKKIRQYLIDNNFIDCIIQLPDNLFFGTSIATCIMVLKRGKQDSNILFIDASKECVKVTNNNRLTAENLDRIMEVFTAREDVPHVAHLASYQEVAEQDYNLSIRTYVEVEDAREKIDIEELNAKIEKIVAREQILRDEIAKINCKLAFHSANIKTLLPIRALGKWTGGCTPSMSKSAYWENGTIPWISSKDMKSSVLADTKDHITVKALDETSIKLLPAHVVAIVARSGILKHTLPVAYVPFETTVNQDIKALETNEYVLPRYAFFAISSHQQDILKKAKKQGGTVDSLDLNAFMNYQIPVPSIEEQQQIIVILDRLTNVYNDLTSSMSVEIEARQKQYEYYRDKLFISKEPDA